MNTLYAIFVPFQTPIVQAVDLPERPQLEDIEKLVLPVIGKDNDMEHVSVLWHFPPISKNPARRDMFVDETGALKGLQMNPLATRIYQNATIVQHKPVDPSALAKIYGSAVLFEKRVWF